MIPVVKYLATNLGMPVYPMLFGLFVGTCVGGNITPIGAATNIVAVGLLRKEGHPVTFKEFAKVGLPFTVVATMLSPLFIWSIWIG